MRIAVTGASGFIGRHVLRELERYSHLEVVAVSRSLAPDIPTVRQIRLDITDLPSNVWIHMGRPDVLLHLAWGGLPHYQSPHHVQIELPAQLMFLTACIEQGLPRLVVTGTCYEYGQLGGELSEDMAPQPCTQYGTAKDELRTSLFMMREKFSFSLAWLRLFYLYGPGQSPTSLYTSLQTAMARGDVQFPMSGGEQLRDFLPIETAARMIVDSALHQDIDGIFNLCSGRPQRLRDLVRSWIEAAGSSIGVQLGVFPYATHEPMEFWGNPGRWNKAKVSTSHIL